ncbi:MAG: thioredoxin domain-containing protein [Saprospiraceae bacterium]|nr:thioredoxin domain-containing protein [Saprospiraceae bacterium]
MVTNPYEVLDLFLRKNKYYFNKRELQLQLEAHPNYPSVRSFTDILDFYRVEHIAATVPEESFDQLPNRWLAVVSPKGFRQIALVERQVDRVNLASEDGRMVLSNAEFIKQWEGVILAVEPNENTSSTWRNSSITSILGILLLLCLGGSLWIQGMGWPQMLYTLLSGLGLYFTILVLKAELGFQSAVTDKWCQINSATDCTEVITSKGSRLPMNVSLGDVALIFFLLTICTTVFIAAPAALFFPLAVASLPVVLYTFLYQWKEVKKWCTLCLGISAVLLSQFLVLYLADRSVEVFASTYLAVVALFLLLSIGWQYAKSLIREHQGFKKEAMEYSSFKKEADSFTPLLQAQRQFELSNMDHGSALIMGNPNAKFKLYAVTNPSCTHCRPTFLGYQKLLERYGDRISLILRFNISLEDSSSPTLHIAAHTVAIYKNLGPAKALKALAEWFQDQDFEAWQSKFSQPLETGAINILQQHRDWCNAQGLIFTPVSILNEHLLPPYYNMEDIYYLLEDFLPRLSTTTTEVEEVAA